MSDGSGSSHSEHTGSADALPPALRPTGPQLAAVALTSVIALVGGLTWAAAKTNLGLGARDVGRRGDAARNDHDARHARRGHA